MPCSGQRLELVDQPLQPLTADAPEGRIARVQTERLQRLDVGSRSAAGQKLAIKGREPGRIIATRLHQRRHQKIIEETPSAAPFFEGEARTYRYDASREPGVEATQNAVTPTLTCTSETTHKPSPTPNFGVGPAGQYRVTSP